MHRTHAALLRTLKHQSSRTENLMNQLIKKGLLAWLFFCAFSLFPFVLQASHLLGGHLTWASSDSIPNQVQFKFIAVFELDDVKELFSERNKTFSVGAIFEDTTGDMKLFFGDDSSTLITHYRIIEIGDTDKWVKCVAVDTSNTPDLAFVHNYPSATDGSNAWKATIDGCCRIDDLENADDNDKFIMSTFVVADSSNQSPESLRVPFVKLPGGGERSFRISFSGTDLGWRLAGSNESTITRQSIGAKNNDDLKVDSQGLLTWNTESLAIGGLWTAQLIVSEDIDENTVEVPFDFAIKITENQNPVCEAPDRHIVRLGDTLNFSVTASDADSSSGDEVILSVKGLPDGAEMKPTLPDTGNPVVSTFSWTPTNVGEDTVSFFATDVTGSKDSCTVIISVVPCLVEIVSPQDGATVCDDNIQVTAVVKAVSGFEVVPGACTINDVIATVIDDTLLVAKIPVEFGPNTIKVQCVLVSGQNDTTACSGMIQVNRSGDPKCFVKITSPRDSSEVTTERVTIFWTTEVEGGSLPFIISCEVNGVDTFATAKSFKNDFSALIPLNQGDNRVLVTCTVVDSCGRETICRDSILVRFIREDLMADAGPDTTICLGQSVQIGADPTAIGGTPPYTFSWSPGASLDDSTKANPIASPNTTTTYVVTVTDNVDSTATDSVTITVTDLVAGAGEDVRIMAGESVMIGGSPTASDGSPPYTISWSPTDGLDDPTIANPTAAPDMTTTYVVTVTDINGCKATDDVVVIVDSVGCQVEIRYPMDGEFVCDDSAKVKANFNLITDLEVICDINGLFAEADEDGIFMTKIPLQPGDNQIIAKCVLVDSNGVEVTVCADTISVFSDPTPPVCEVDFTDYPIITGTITDEESGIALVEVKWLRNRVVTIDTVEISTSGESVEFNGETSVSFSSVLIGDIGALDLRIVNRAGCETRCDPIDVTLRPDGPPCNFNFSLPHTDRWLYVENNGLTRVKLVVNEKIFNLFNSGGLRNEANSYAIPSYGTIGFDLKNILRTGENNFRLVCEGPSGSYANILITDFLRNDVGEPEIIEFQEVRIPTEFALLQNHPNPFNPATNIRFNIPANFTDGIQVKLRIYNLMGQLVNTLVDEQRFPGEHTARWDGRNQRDEAISSGIYIYQLVAGEFKLTKRMVFLK